MLTQTAPADTRTATLAAVRARWNEILADPYWQSIDGRVESDALGQVIVMPPPGFPHSRRQGGILHQLKALLGGHSLPEIPLLTTDGVKGLDAGWFSAERFALVVDQDPCEIAPEICVEVCSPGNTKAELAHKRALYFAAGALECWVCELDGSMSFYESAKPDAAMLTSKLCGNFPVQIVV